jgi:hypothetical protein
MVALVFAVVAGFAAAAAAGAWQFRARRKEADAPLRRPETAGSLALTVGYNGALFLAMVCGTFANYFWVHGFMTPIDVDGLWKPLLVSPIVFLPVYTAVTRQPRGLIPILLAFQNGFFWQTVLESAH